MITYDSLVLNSFILEQKSFFIGARINKIQQPTRRELLITLRNFGESRQFYINIDPKFYHVCFTNEENLKRKYIKIPQKPPMFCMLLRKYLNNAKLSKINQPEKERILELYFETYNELGDIIYLCLAIELMGKYSNVILYNYDTGIILGCAHNVGSDKSQVREVYGQIPYTYPPKLYTTNFINERYAFILSYKNNIGCEFLNNRVIDDYYTKVISREKFKILKSKYFSDISLKLKKNEKSLTNIENQLRKNSEADKYRLFGDLLMSNLYSLHDYSKSVNLYDYENSKEINIELDATKTIKDNANKFYKKYNKAKGSNVKLLDLQSNYAQNKAYLDSLLYSIEISSNIDELTEVITEIEDFNGEKKSEKQTFIEPIKVDLDCNSRIFIGKNNKQNNYIISKLADDEDLWFHTKDCPGSHVLLKTQDPITDELILLCAKLAKQHSSASNSSKVGVIYTKRKYLRKPPKAALGYVTYKNEKEIIID